MDKPGQAKDLLGPEAAPDSLVARYGLLTLKGIGNTPAGMLHAAEEDFNHPLQTVGMIAGAAAVGALIKTYLPKAGTAGKVAGLAIGAYVTYRASEPIIDSFTIAGQAKTMNDIDVASRLLGDVAGSFVVNSALSGLAYRAGSMGAERAFNIPKINIESAAKIGFWSNSVAPRLPGAFGVTTASTTSMMFEPRLAGIQKFASSEPIFADGGKLSGPTDANTPLSITVQLKSKASDQEMDQVLKNIALGKQPNLTDKEFNEKFGATPESLDNVTKFAENYGLKVSESDLRSGRVVLTGTAAQFSDAFRTQLNQYNLDGLMIRNRSGALFVPKAIAKDIEGVFGLDNRPQARPHIQLPNPKGNDAGKEPSAQSSYRADEVANAYHFPKGTTGKGQAAAVIELGGGIDMKNESEYYKQNGLKMPNISVLEINGAKSSTGRNLRADTEVSLDSQILGTVAPDAKQTIIFTSNNEQGFIDAIARGSFPNSNETSHQAMAISWGQPIEAMTEQGKRGMDLALKKAALRGVSVFAAAGDDGASDNVSDEKLHVDYPAANQYATGVGGTIISIKNGKIESEVAWNDNRGATGGGISPLALPEFQKELKYATKGLSGRGVPDIAGNASPNSGYKIRSAGNDIVTGGTSAVAPLYAALALRLNEGLGGGDKTVGFMNPFLYQLGIGGSSPSFRDITQGNNNGFETAKGWDPVTGWGSLDGEKLLEAYKKAGK